MPTLPLYSPPSDPNAWHRVIAPGGYEWWRFDAEDALSNRRIVVRFILGLIERPAYARAYRRYRKHPTRHAPPLPGDVIGVEVCFYQADRIRFHQCFEYAPRQFQASITAPAVTIGLHQFESLPDASLRVQSRGSGAPALDLVFRPKFQHRAPSPIVWASEHWRVAQPLCDVHGRIAVDGESTDFNGLGYHDHLFATAPPAEGTSTLWGRVLLDDFAYALRAADGSAGLVRIESTSVDKSMIAPRVVGGFHEARRSLLYPDELLLNSTMQLSNPRLMGLAFSAAHLKYDALIDGTRRATAWCEVRPSPSDTLRSVPLLNHIV